MPDWSDPIRKQLAGLSLAPAREAEIVEELSQHAEERYRELQAGGATEPEARRMALHELTAHQLLARELRSVGLSNSPILVPGLDGKGHMLAGLAQDLRFGLRTLARSPGFTAVAILALALGIGANTAMFSVVNGVLLQPLAYPDPGRLLRIFEQTPDSMRWSVAYPNYLDWRRENQSFADMGAYRDDDFNFTGAGEPERLSGMYVSASLFPTLGVAPVRGRNFLLSEDAAGSACSVILSYGLWQERFAGDRNILDKALTLNGSACSVVGILPRTFRLRDDAVLFMPIEQWKSVELHNREVHPGLRVFGRLKPGVSVAAAHAEMVSISSALAKQYPSSNASHSSILVPLKDDIVESIRPTLLLLLGAVGFVLIIACANVANLLLARSAGRKREFAIRAALGAQRWRVVRQLLTESVLLSIGAAAVGLLLARWGTSAVLAAVPGSLPRSSEVGIDTSVLIFTLALSIVTGILFGLAPAFQTSHSNPQDSLKEGGRGVGGGRHRTESVFVMVEIGLAVILVAGAGLMVKSLWRLLQVDPGFNASNLLTMQFALSPKVMSEPQRTRAAFEEVLGRVDAVSGVRSAGMTALVPLAESDNENSIWLGDGPQPPQDRLNSAMFYVVSPEYEKVMQIPLRRGRFFTTQDNVNSPKVVVIDDVLANHYFPGQDPIGRKIGLMAVGSAQVVGVVGHVKHWGLDSDDTNKIRDQLYFPLLQVPDEYMADCAMGLSLVMRTGAKPLSLVSPIRAQVAGPTQDQPIYSIRTMDEIITGSVSERRFTMLLLLVFAGTAVLLAALGIYGVMSYSVSRRIQELGIRNALGASRGEIVRLVLGQGMRTASIGMGAGVLIAVLLTRLLSHMLFAVAPGDPATLVIVVLALGAIALVACYIPARRAAAVDPIVALRCE